MYGALCFHLVRPDVPLTSVCPVTTSARWPLASHDSRTGKSIPVQKGSPQGGQVHYTDAAAGASSDGGRSSALCV